ncbi:phosphopantothenoylcysteine decarboxylase [Biomphalaria glabrata]|nr:phosphopantothenoylcysteine decarboxylase-like [Biomphalaria glabrata]
MASEKVMPAPHILIGCTGSVASIKIPMLIESLQQLNPKPEIKVVSTQHALHFFRKEEQNVIIYTDSDEWETWSSIQDPVLHIELRKWADVMIIAPLDANTLAKIANGLCDNLLTCVVRAWDFHKPLMFAPAMNTCMYEHPITATQIDLLKKLGYKEIPCISKKLACGDTGFGAMAEVPTLVSAVEQSLSGFNKNAGNTSLPSTSQSSGL